MEDASNELPPAVAPEVVDGFLKVLSHANENVESTLQTLTTIGDLCREGKPVLFWGFSVIVFN